MTGVQPRRTGTGYKAAAQGQSSIGSRSPYSFGLHSGKSGGVLSQEHNNLPWEICTAVRRDYRIGNDAGERSRSQQRP
jgi:hypothetical protein